MKMTMTAIAAAAAIAAAGIVAAPQQAEARCVGCAVGAGVIGGLAVGAIIGSAANGPYYGGPGPAYYGPGYAYGPGCYWTRERFWDGFRWRSHRVRVCG